MNFYLYRFNFGFYQKKFLVCRVYRRVGATLTDLGAQLTQGVLLGTDQRLLKPFFDILKNRGEGTSQN